jgi:hypothetical protein
MEQEDGRLGRIEAAHGARCGICGVPKGGEIVMSVGKVDVRHFLKLCSSSRDVYNVYMRKGNPHQGCILSTNTVN